MTVIEFGKRFPNEDVCLQKIFNLKYGNLKHCPKCSVENPKFYKVRNRKCYECGKCGHQIFPLVGTIMEKSSTSLVLWFMAIYEFSINKQGTSIRRLRDRLGVTLKTAWRMCHKIRSVMQDDNDMILSGIVEIDECLLGGKARGKRGWGAKNKICVFGMIERKGRVKLKVVENRKYDTLIPIINNSIKKLSTIYSDEFKVYKNLKYLNYHHESICHSEYEWSNEDCHTNSMEGFWSNLKKWIRGTHTWVSKKYIHNYLNEFCFRHNRRTLGNGGIFDEILNGVAGLKPTI